MRTSSNTKLNAVVDALNAALDRDPEAIASLVQNSVLPDTVRARREEEKADLQGMPDRGCEQSDAAERVDGLDLINLVVGAVIPGRRIATITERGKITGFALARLPKAQSAAE